MLPITETTDPLDYSPLIPQIALQCRGDGKRWGTQCKQTAHVPMDMFANAQDLQDYLIDQDFVAMFYGKDVPEGTELENDEGQTLVVDATTPVSVAVIEVACLHHAESVLEDFELMEAEE